MLPIPLATARRPFDGLVPEAVLEAVEQVEGLRADGRLFALNSYENRVYQVGIEDAPPVVVKFYRANRWSDAQILEEHAFATELLARDLSVAAPLGAPGATLHYAGDFRFAVFPWLAGRAPEIDDRAALTQLGRSLGRLHAVGRVRHFEARQPLDPQRFGAAARRRVLHSPQLDPALRERYAEISASLLERIVEEFEAVGELSTLRIHGDCHPGNVLWDVRGPVFVDLDDCLEGPAIQDLWMFLAGESDEQRGRWESLAEGYREFADFDYRELRLVEPLRGLRMLRHVAWIAERWDDPAFPRAFPGFAEPRFWEGHLNELMEQRPLLDDPPLLRG
jgi:Ser/Thr protein kinase RdoA (MazF antagonist)